MNYIENKTAKFELYIISLWLLFLLIIVLTLEIPICFEPDARFIGFEALFKLNVIPSIAFVFLLIGCILYFRFDHKLKGSNDLPSKVLKAENVSFEHLTFLTTYIIPLICIDLNKPRYAIIFLILLIIIGLIYVRTNLFYANPSLALLGYQINRIDIKTRSGTQENIIFISRNSVNEGQEVIFKQLDKNIFYGKVC